MKKKNIIDEISLKMMPGMDVQFNVSDQELLKLIKTVPDVNMPGRDGRTLLIHAALYNRIEILKWLLGHGGNIDAQDYEGLTALHCAAASKHYEIAEILVSHHAQLNLRDRYGNTPLFRVSHLQPEMALLLVRAGADCKVKNLYDVSLYDKYQAYPDMIAILEGKTK